jgi:hypothetical protein
VDPAITGSDHWQGYGYIGAGRMAAVTGPVLEGGRTREVDKWRRRRSQHSHFSHLNLDWTGLETHKGISSENNVNESVFIIT